MGHFMLEFDGPFLFLPKNPRMDNPILTTKSISPAERDHLVLRGALFDRLGEGLSAHRLILIPFDLLTAYPSESDPRQLGDPAGVTFCEQLIRAFSITKHKAVIQAAGLTTAQPGAVELVEPLSPRELEVLALIVSGLSNPEIVRKLYLTTNTLKAHTGSIFGKLDVHTRMAAVVKARELGLIKS